MQEDRFQKNYLHSEIYVFTHTKNSQAEVEDVLKRERRMLEGEDVGTDGPQLVFIDKRSEDTYVSICKSIKA